MPNEININSFNELTPEEKKIQFIRDLKTSIKDFYTRISTEHKNIFDIILGNGQYSVPEIIQSVGPEYTMWLLEISAIINMACKKADPNYIEPDLGVDITELLKNN